MEDLKWNEHIRKRPGMYLGGVNHKGFVLTLMKIITQITTKSNSDFVHITIKNQNEGILHFKNLRNSLRQDIGIINLDYSSNTIDLPILNAVSSKMVLIFFNSIRIKQKFICGNSLKQISNQELHCSDLKIKFFLDKQIWGINFTWNTNYIFHELREFCYLNRQIKFELSDRIGEKPNNNFYHFKYGLKDRLQIEILNAIGPSYFEHHLFHKTDAYDLEIAFAIRSYTIDQNFIKTYVNNEITPENGSHLEGLLKGIFYGLKKYLITNNLVTNYKMSKKELKDGLVCIINIKMENPIFYGSIKNKLVNPEIIEPIARNIAKEIYNSTDVDKDSLQKLMERFKI